MVINYQQNNISELLSEYLDLKNNLIELLNEAKIDKNLVNETSFDRNETILIKDLREISKACEELGWAKTMIKKEGEKDSANDSLNKETNTQDHNTENLKYFQNLHDENLRYLKSSSDFLLEYREHLLMKDLAASIEKERKLSVKKIDSHREILENIVETRRNFSKVKKNIKDKKQKVIDGIKSNYQELEEQIKSGGMKENANEIMGLRKKLILLYTNCFL